MPSSKLAELFTPFFVNLTDPRVARARRHNLLDILVLAVCATLGNADGWADVERFATAKLDFFKTFPDQHLHNRPYKVFFASGDWTCSIARFTGTMRGPMQGPDGKEIPPTGKSFEVDFCTVARWDNGQIVEENLFYDLVTFMRQIGLST